MSVHVTRSKAARGAAIAATVALAAAMAVVATPLTAAASTTSTTLFAWGADNRGQVSDAATAIGEHDVMSMSAFGEHAVALLSNGTVASWGNNGAGDDGNDQAAAAIGSSTVTAVAAGGNFSLALLSDGSVVGWGDDTDGQISGAAAAIGDSTVVQISAGSYYALALLSDGSVVGWGSDNGSYHMATGGEAAIGDGTVVKLVAGNGGSFALLADGTLAKWGFIPSGESTAIGDHKVTALSSSLYDTVAVLDDGSVVGWGNDSGQYGTALSCIPSALGDNDAVDVAAGGNMTAMRLADGTVITCGDDTNGVVSDVDSTLGAAAVTQLAAGTGTVYAVAIPTTERFDNEVDVSQHAVSPGDIVSASGSHARAGLPLTVALDGTTINVNSATDVVDDDGTFSVDGLIPSTTTTGSHTITLAVGPQVYSATLHVAPGFVTATPTIDGTQKVANHVTAVTGVWSEGTTFTYKWYRSGKSIGFTNYTYLVQPADAGKHLTVKVTGTFNGHSVSKTSVSHSTVTPGDLITAAPTTSSDATVGTPLSVTTGSWGPNTVTFGYQWFANGAAISGATHSVYIPTSSKLGKKLTVEVTGKETGYASQTFLTDETDYVAPGTIITGNVTLTGSAVVGSKLSLSAHVFGTGVTSSYQWLRDGVPIRRANSSSYTVTTADRESTLSLRVTGYQVGYDGAQNTSGSTAKVMTATKPTITGTATHGQTLTLVPGTWSPDAALNVQWLRVSGKTVTLLGSSVIYDPTDPLATVPTYQPVTADIGKTIEVRVTGFGGGYDTTVLTSKATSKVK